MAYEYEKPTVTIVSFISMAQLARDDYDRTRTSNVEDRSGFDAGTDLESSIFG